MRRRTKSLTALTGAALGAVLFAAGPAVAAPYWQPLPAGLALHNCTATNTLPGTNVIYQVCVVIGRSSAQSVLIVKNQQSTNVRIRGGSGLNYTGSYASCYESTLSPGYRTVCFANTVSIPAGANPTVWQYDLTVG
ncbi:hypothetical protein ABZ721_32915 [Streptomyces sp. NPDC006733]|uniref:hypothetical protein n=1 Tax=Streptomyces sp. NPDC006733 TaxID=3155460 RepID=UPI0033F8C855